MIADYFTPINENQIPHNDDYKPYTMGNIVTRYYNRFPDITSHHCAIFGIKEERGSEQNFGTAEGMDFIRKELYQLYAPQEGIKIVDLGDIEAGETCKDSYFAIQEVCKYLIENRVIPIILGGGHDNTIGQYMAYKDFGHLIDLVYIDNKLNIDQNSSTVNATNHILDIINANPSFLFNLENVGFQRHLNNPLEAQAMEQLLFDIHNLGSIKQDLKTFEPIARGADMVSFDIASVAIADAPGNKHASTNGLSAIEACQMARYIGISDKVSSFGIYEYNPTFDIRNQTAALVAQMIWYFIDGYYSRVGDMPLKNRQDFIKYTAMIQGQSHEMVFYKSKKSDRWWMEVPIAPIEKNVSKSHLVPCSYQDYNQACNDQEVPEKWWKSRQKFMQ